MSGRWYTIAPLRVGVEILGIVIDRAQATVRVTLRLVHEVSGSGIATCATCADGERPDLGPKLNGRDEAVATSPVISPGSGIALCAKGGQRAPLRGRERNWEARFVVIVCLHDRGVVTLEAVDFTPGHADAAEILCQTFAGSGECGELLRIRGVLGHVIPHGHVRFLGRLRGDALKRFTPELRLRGCRGVVAPF